jgi:SAM-dependent methyltransferase
MSLGKARYDGWADWYDAYVQGSLYRDVPNHLARFIGRGSGVCIDAGCGTGVHLALLRSLGWMVAGVDVSRDQLRLAARRCRSVVQGDVAGLPFSGGVASRVVSVLTLTDFDDVGPFFVEAHRVLAPGGKLVVISTHPCFVGPFVKMEGGAEGVAVVYPGYRLTERVFAGPGIGSGVRSRVGVRHVPLSEWLNKLLASKLQVEHVEELGNGTVPWLLALIASKAHV